MRNHIQFILNDDEIALADISPTDTLLDFLRINQRLTGTKEGCAEGDCGACTVLVGRLKHGKLTYETVNACIRFLATLDGCHVMTIEHLSDFGKELHGVQRAMVDFHASQCGFCTPGIVMSLYGLFLANPTPDEAQIEKALQGNLCRCTGYKPIIDAAMHMSESGGFQKDRLVSSRNQTIRRLKLLDDELVELHHAQSRCFIPSNADQFAKLRAKYPDATIVAGATDVGLWVTKHFAEISPAIFIYKLDDLAKISASRSEISIGAMVSYSDAYRVLERHIPQLKSLWDRIGGEQVRNMGTIGGNIANGSPIGDTPPPFIALGATLTLRKGTKRRTFPLEKFFIEYGKQDLKPGEFVEAITVPKPARDQQFASYKISKRKDEDITAVLAAFLVSFDKNKLVTQARIAYGGMAGTPKRASAVEKYLLGKSLNRETVENARPLFERDFRPLSDWRASAEYRMIVAQNLLKRFMIESKGHEVQIERALPFAAQEAAS